MVDSSRVGVPDVSAWPGVVVTGALTGGARAAVHAARRGQERLVVKVSPRRGASLDWELELLVTLDRAGVKVPVPVSTADGRLGSGSVFVTTFLPGGPPRTADHWRAAASAVARVHEVTDGWPQRPGSASAAQLMSATRGADVDLAAMPAAAVALVRTCWRPLVAGPAVEGARRCVVHGDLGTGAFMVDSDAVAIIDWDEARVDAPTFDTAALVAAASGALPALEGLDRQVLADAALAWEAATCWVVEPSYARRCLERLQRRRAARRAWWRWPSVRP